MDLWNALPDAIHCAGMAVLAHWPALRAIVVILCQLAGIHLYEDGTFA